MVWRTQFNDLGSVPASDGETLAPGG
jgi:hypothetical protein